MTFEEDLDSVLTEIRDLLIKKNRSYGNSFAEPVRIFAKNVSPGDQILVRIDDKLARLKSGTDEFDEDTVLDTLGYLILWRIARIINARYVKKEK